MQVLGLKLAASKLRQKKPHPLTPLGGSWYLLTNFNCTYNCTYEHIRALKGLLSGL